MENPYGKYDKSTLVDNDLTNYFQFPTLKREVYIEEIQKEDGIRTTRVIEEFGGLQRPMLINLRNLSIFRTQMDAMQCTKLLASRMHGGSLWLDKEYPIHVDDIHCLTGLSARENVVNTLFQVGMKREKK